ncbi:MAG TPA: biopolymer transporter ExbD [Anaeromyxobacteraceae bacterium]|nr:biopolymer transporter ExbD [Anaeromyxobacteraceae bacterium]
MAATGPGGGGDDLEGEGGGGIFAEINITPLTDIFLVLLIIFMVTTTAIAEAGAGQSGGLQVSLPHAGKTAPTTTLHDIAIAVLQDGRTVVSGKVVTDDALAELLDRARARNPDTLVLVQADEGVAHGKVVAVMDLARRHGLTRLAIATREGAEPAAH